MTILSSVGTTLDISDGEMVPADIAILGITGYSGFDGEAPDLDETTFADLEFKTFRQGLVDNGGFNIDLFRNLADLGQAEMEEIAATQETRQFTLSIIGYGKIIFFAYVKSMPIDGAIDESLSGSIPLKITGEPTYTPTPP